MRRRLPRVVAGAMMAVATAGSCSDAPTAPARPEPGVLTVRLATPHADDRAALIRLVLPAGMTTAAVEAATPGLEVLTRRSADTLRIAVFGDLTTQPVARIAVPDVRAASRVAATLVEVADEQDALRGSLAGYAVVVERP